MSVMDSMNQKVGPAPLWMWGLGTAILGTWYIIHRKNQAASANSQSTQAAADQTNTNLGSASQLANLFEVAGLMPYQGGDTYVNVGGPAGVHGGNPPQKVTVGSQTAFETKVQQGDTWASIAKRFGISASHLQQYNAVSKNRGGLGSIDTTKPLVPGQRVVVPWANQ